MIAPEEQARATLRGMRHTRDTVLNLLLIEAGLAIQGLHLVKTCNIGVNLGVSPELALARVIVGHLTNCMTIPFNLDQQEQRYPGISKIVEELKKQRPDWSHMDLMYDAKEEWRRRNGT